MIDARNLRKIYESKYSRGLFKSEKVKVEAVKDISLRINKGEIVGFLGINGAGKTTTIKMLTTLISPTSGSYMVDGIDAIKNPMEIKKKINMVAGGEKMLYWRLTAYENLEYYGSLYGIEKRVLKERIDYLLKLVGLDEVKNKKVEEYSKGMKQRLQIARGLINDPEYLLLDEPTLGLDTIVARELRNNIKYLAKEKNKGILLTSHYLDEVEELCDYIYIIDKGTIIMKGTIKELSNKVFSYSNFKLEVYCEDSSLEESLTKYLKNFDIAVTVKKEKSYFSICGKEELKEKISEFIMINKIKVKEFIEIVPSLEDIIISITNNKEILEGGIEDEGILYCS